MELGDRGKRKVAFSSSGGGSPRSLASSSPGAFDDRSARKEPKKYRQQSENYLILQHGLQALSVWAVAIFLHAFGELIFPNPFVHIGDLLRGGDAHPR